MTVKFALCKPFAASSARRLVSSALLLIHSGGEVTNVDFDKAIATAKKGTVTRDAELVKKAKALADEQGFVAKPKKDKSDDFQITIERHVAKGATLQTTLNLLVERATGDDSPAAAIFIDSIDVSVLPVKKEEVRCCPAHCKKTTRPTNLNSWVLGLAGTVCDALRGCCSAPSPHPSPLSTEEREL